MMKMCDLCNVFGCIKGCPNYNEDKEGFIICPNCEEHLHNGDIYYPEFDICEFCIDDYKVSVDVNYILEPEDK
jgi:hypothetical protein